MDWFQSLFTNTGSVAHIVVLYCLVIAVGVVLGSVLFRLVYTIALRFDMPAFMLKLISSIIVVLAISIPYLKKQMPMIKRRLGLKTQKGGV